jgi:hypothetical protein
MLRISSFENRAYILAVIVGSLRWEPTTERSLLVGESK